MTMESNRDNKTLERILGPTEPEVTCEQCFDLLDQYVELELAGADPDAKLPGLRAHLAGCHESLRDLVSARDSSAD
jgi:hypothetical protein